ncbi:MAG: hypothetical protein IJ874_09170 [Ruminococcus sp.]|nr:hypothetical protein [Ruminococcus sp.]
MSHKWEINGLSLELDLDDADNMERYEKAFDIMAAEEKQIPKDGKQSERIRAYCKLFRNLFDRIFGEGTAEKIFSKVPTSTTAYDEVYISFLEFARGQMIANAQARAEWLSKYAPNRKQRRAASKTVRKSEK